MNKCEECAVDVKARPGDIDCRKCLTPNRSDTRLSRGFKGKDEKTINYHEGGAPCDNCSKQPIELKSICLVCCGHGYNQFEQRVCGNCYNHSVAVLDNHNNARCDLDPNIYLPDDVYAGRATLCRWKPIKPVCGTCNDTKEVCKCCRQPKVKCQDGRIEGIHYIPCPDCTEKPLKEKVWRWDKLPNRDKYYFKEYGDVRAEVNRSVGGKWIIKHGMLVKYGIAVRRSVFESIEEAQAAVELALGVG